MLYVENNAQQSIIFLIFFKVAFIIFIVILTPKEMFCYTQGSFVIHRTVSCGLTVFFSRGSLLYTKLGSFVSTWVKYYCSYHREPKRMTLMLFDQKSGGKVVSCFFLPLSFSLSLSHIQTLLHHFRSTACVTFGLESEFWHRPRACSPCWH